MKNVIKEIKQCWVPSVFVSIPLVRLITLLLISLLGATSFFSHVAINCPCPHVYWLPSSQRSMPGLWRLEQKTVITQKAANSWVIRTYFIQCCKQEKYTHAHKGAHIPKSRKWWSCKAHICWFLDISQNCIKFIVRVGVRDREETIYVCNMQKKTEFGIPSVWSHMFTTILVTVCSSAHLIFITHMNKKINFGAELEKMNYVPPWEIRRAIKPLMIQKVEKG